MTANETDPATATRSTRPEAPAGAASDAPAGGPSQPRPTLPERMGELDRRAIDTVRVLAMDAVQKARNGLVDAFSGAGGGEKQRDTQVPVCYDADEEAARDRAHRLWRWSTAGSHVMAELPEPRSFEAASESVTAADVAAAVPCGPDVERHVEAVRKAVDAGYTHVAVVQVGAETQAEFVSWAAASET